MIKPISKNDLDSCYACCPIDYSQYLIWLDDEVESQEKFYTIATTNINLRDRSQWNSLGREIYNKDNLLEHAQLIGNIIDSLQLSRFLVQHEYQTREWLPHHANFAEACEMFDYLSSRVGKLDFLHFNGSFDIRDEIGLFIAEFADYPFLLKWINIDCISLESKSIIKITRHLSIDFITTDRELIRQVQEYCCSLNLNFVEGRS